MCFDVLSRGCLCVVVCLVVGVSSCVLVCSRMLVRSCVVCVFVCVGFDRRVWLLAGLCECVVYVCGYLCSFVCVSL